MPTEPSALKAALRAALDFAHQTLEATMADVTDELANKPAPGRANPIGAAYAHVLHAEDAIVNGLLKGKPPFWTAGWAGRSGIDRPMPMPGVVEGDIGEWYHGVRVELAPMREYARAVYANTLAYLETAGDAELGREIETSIGTMTATTIVADLVIAHCNQLCGEISAIKGANGLKGYPF